MTRLIDADALLNRMQKDPLFDLVERYGVSGVINAEPTVDAVPVIRCKDCKYFERRSIYHHGLCDVHCNGVGEKEVTSEDQYCSWAERKEE